MSDNQSCVLKAMICTHYDPGVIMLVEQKLDQSLACRAKESSFGT
jgi:hypothetical protein